MNHSLQEPFSLILAIAVFLGTGSAEALQKMKQIRVMQESLTQKHFAIDSEMLRNAGKGDDGKLGSRLIEITSEVSLSSPSEAMLANQDHECITDNHIGLIITLD